MIKAATAINSFAPVAQQADVSPEEPIFVLTGSQLQEIISRAVLPLQAELQDLKDTIARQEEKMAALEATQDTQAENLFIQLQLINKLKHIPKEGDEVPILNELYKEMKAIGRKQTDFATAARMVKRSKRRMIQLKTAIALDQRFILVPSESHSQKILIRLR